MPSPNPLQVVAFDSQLGWIAVAGAGRVVKQTTFGHASRAAALSALESELRVAARVGDWCPTLVARLQEYASGAPHDFRDVELDLDHLTDFQQRIVKHCRAIGYGCTLSYGELARKSGSPRAARAVGSTMAANRFPLLVPCHRVVHSGGDTGGFSGPQGVRMKLRLLEMEDQAVARAKQTRAKTGKRSAATASSWPR